MLLAIDIGNSNISVGLFDKARELRFLASLDTDSRKTADQISIDLMNLFTLYGCDIHDVSGAIFASVAVSYTHLAAIQRVYEPEGKKRQLHQRPLESIEVVYPVLL